MAFGYSIFADFFARKKITKIRALEKCANRTLWEFATIGLRKYLLLILYGQGET